MTPRTLTKGVYKPSALEAKLAFHIRASGLPTPHTEWSPIPGRKFRFDFAWPTQKLLVEVQGGLWGKGGHTSGVGVTRDCEKLCLAVIEGYRVLHVTGDQITSGKAILWITKALALGWEEGSNRG